MASHDSARGPNGLPLNRREVLTLTGAASAVATTQAFTNAASAAAEHTPHIVMDDALTLADTISLSTGLLRRGHDELSRSH